MSKGNTKYAFFSKRLVRKVAGGLMLLLSAALTANLACADDWIIEGGQATSLPATTSFTTPHPPHIYFFAIPSQALPTALHAFSSATGLQVFYNSRIATGHVSPGVSGFLSAEAALDALLAGTNLTSIRTDHNVVTLALRFETVKFVATPPIEAPMLRLNPIRTEAPRSGEHFLYAATVRYAIQNALQQDRILCHNNYRVNMIVWISPSGIVRHSEFLVSTGNRDLDIVIAQVVRRVAVGQSPPFGLPQPVHIDVLASRAAVRPF